MRLPPLIPAVLVALAISPAALGQDGSKPPPVCVSCAPRPEYCWMYLYRWTSYNSKSGFGTGMISSPSETIGKPEIQKVEDGLRASLPKGTQVTVRRPSAVACPKPKDDGWRR